MSITVNCSIELTEEELFLVLAHRHEPTAGWDNFDNIGRAIRARDFDREHPVVTEPTGPESAGAIVVGPEGVTKDEAGPSRLLEPIPEERIEAAASSHIPAALPPKPTRRERANGAEAPINSTPLAPNTPPPPEPLDEPAMRSLLSKVGAVHPLKVKAITDLLEAHGGHRRLSECDPSTWPAIAEAAFNVLVEQSK